MGKSLAGDCGRLTALPSRLAVALFNFACLPIYPSTLEEIRHAR